jgi:undecaprenyl diphosphate synthase
MEMKNKINNKMPIHVVVIPDGDRRWSREHGFNSLHGHNIAVDKIIPKVIDYAVKSDIKYLTFWLMSTENIKSRSSQEIDNLFNLLTNFFKFKIKETIKKNIRLKIIGDRLSLKADLQKVFNNAEEMTAKNSGLTVIFAINYGGRDEIIRAIKKVQSSKFKVQSLSEKQFGEYVDTAGLPDPDIIIRTGKVMRLSGFMSWQSAYSELFFPEVYFPDFTVEIFEEIISQYQQRKRRFGK